MSRWGNPSAPKFWAGPKGWSVWNQEFSWKARCKKENAEFDAKVAAANGLPQGEGGVSLNLGATNPHLSADMPAASLGSVMREQAKLKGEIRGLRELLSVKYEQEVRARVLAEQEARAHNVEKNKIQAEITAYKKTVEQLKRRTLGSRGSVRTGRSYGGGRSASAAPLSPALSASGLSVVSKR